MKVLLVATVQSHICQFHKPLAAMLHAHGSELHVAARNNLAEKNGLTLDFAEQVFDLPFSRSPQSPDNLKAYRQLKQIIDEGGYEIVHCNTPVGGIVARLAARSARKHGTKVFYTAHGFHFYDGAPRKNWLAFYPVEKQMAHFCDTLITITEEDYHLASKRFPTNIARIHGVGVYTDRYHPVAADDALAMRAKEGLSADDYVMLCVGELNQNKNQKTLIAAAAQLKEKIPKLKILLAGNGPKEAELKAQIAALGLEQQVLLLGYRTDLETITPAVNLVVSCSHREGLPLNILEAMLCRKPVVASVNRGHKELVVHGVTGYQVQPDAAEEYAACIQRLYHNPGLAASMGNAGYEKALDYSAESVTHELARIYGYERQS